MTNEQLLQMAISQNHEARAKSIKIILFAKTKTGPEQKALMQLSDFLMMQSETIDLLMDAITQLRKEND